MSLHHPLAGVGDQPAGIDDRLPRRRQRGDRERLPGGLVDHVDYIVEVGRELWAIEVKASRSVDARDMRGLVAFQERAGKVSRSLIVYLGARRQRFHGAEAVPLTEFLAELPS